jgi:SagB-type dehydrogenase family enzyme
MLIFLALLLIPEVSAMAQTITLPEPSRDGETTLEEAIDRRHSVRSFTDEPLRLAQVGRLLWAGGGVSVDGVSGPTRTAPSAGGLYPIEVYLVAGQARDLEPGVYRYRWREHELERIVSGDLRGRLRRAALGQGAVADAPCVVVLGANYAVTRARYGSRGVERYVHMDAGHAAQNLLLQAEALGLGMVPIGAFNNSAVRELLEIETEPLYLLPVGYPR